MDPFEAAKKKKWLNEKRTSRDIVKKILDFGVSQSQIRNIISLLSLELDSNSEMKAIKAILEENGDCEKSERKNILIPGEENE